MPRRNGAGRVTSYGVRWQVDGARFYRSFKVKSAAEGFRSDLISAQRKGERFDTVAGLPLSMSRPKGDASWFDFTCRYVDMKWPDLAATARQTVAESLIRVMPVFMPQDKRAPAARTVGSALRQWGYNTEPADQRRRAGRRASGARMVFAAHAVGEGRRRAGHIAGVAAVGYPSARR